MKIDIHAFDGSGSVKNYSERSLGCDFWVEMFERTRCRIPGIGEQRQSGSFPFFVQFLEAVFVQVSFSTNFENLRHRAAQLMWHRSNRFDVLGDVVPDQTVTSGRGIF